MASGLVRPIGDLHNAEPEEVGLSSARLSRIDDVIIERLGRGDLPGMISMVVRHGHVAHFSAVGYDDVQARTPLAKDAVMAIASLTKPIATVALLMVYERTGLMLEDPISKYLPAFKNPRVLVRHDDRKEVLEPARREITVRDCLTHTAGFGRVPIAVRPQGLAADVPVSESMPELAEKPLAYHPGARWEYAAGHTVAGHLVEVLSGQSLEDFCQENIFRPLAMTDTSFRLPAEKASRLTNLYNREDTAEGPKLTRGAAREVRAEAAARRVRFDGSGGLFSTATDYVRFAQMLLNMGAMDGTRYLSRKTIELMTTDHIGDLNQYVTGPGDGYGLGVFVRRDLAARPAIGSLGAYGWGGATGCYYVADPAEDMILLSFSNTNGYWQNWRRGWNWLHQFEKLAYQAIID